MDPDHTVSVRPSLAFDRLLAGVLARRSFLILTYHGIRNDDVQPQTVNLQGKHLSRSAFAEQIDYLAATGYRFLNGDDLRWIVQRRQLPRHPAVLVTFDDGYANTHSVALPILSARGITAIVFVVGGFVAQREPLWVDRLEHAFMGTSSEQITVDLDVGTRRFCLRRFHERRSAEAHVRAQCKRLAPVDRARLLEDVLARLEGVPSPMPSLYDPLSWQQIDELRRAGWEIGSHTMTHTILAGLKPRVARQEVEAAKNLLEDRLNEPCDLFAYPNGLQGDFTPATKRMLADIGKLCALASIEGRVSGRLDPFAMRRVSVRDGVSRFAFRARMTGAVGAAKRAKAVYARSTS